MLEAEGQEFANLHCKNLDSFSDLEKKIFKIKCSNKNYAYDESQTSCIIRGANILPFGQENF